MLCLAISYAIIKTELVFQEKQISQKMIFLGLFLILVVVLVAPFSVKKVEEELEVFLFVMGCLAVTITGQWSLYLLKEALSEPVKITLAVFIAGFLFRALQAPIARRVNSMADAVGVKLFAFLLIAILGLLSSVITAIIAALVLVEIISHLTLERKSEIILVVLACFSIGLGAALTPIGEPLSTIAIAKLKGAPYHAGFLFLFRHLWLFVIPGIVLLGLLGAVLVPLRRKCINGIAAGRDENIKDITLRAIKVYLFVMALIFLGQGFKPIIDAYISKLPPCGLYWLNIISAIVDNATLTAAEIGPGMALIQIKSALLGLLIAGGMLIPGNIPNIICAGKLKIRSSEWARFGVPLGLAGMAVCFLALLFFC
jgi:predicted cation transporter